MCSFYIQCCTLLKVVGYYDLSVLSMSVVGLPKKLGWGVDGWGEPLPVLFSIFGTVSLCNAPKYSLLVLYLVVV